MLGKLIVIGTAVLNLGTILEADGIVERHFWLRNDSSSPLTMVQGYTSCGCTTVAFPRDSVISAGDSAMVSLRFNPRGKGGEFYESATIQYVCLADSAATDRNRPRVQLALEGTCVTSRETLRAQHPYQVAPHLYASSTSFDVGYLAVGDHRTRSISLWHDDGETGKTERRTINIDINGSMPKGINHLPYELSAVVDGEEIKFIVTIDVMVK